MRGREREERKLNEERIGRIEKRERERERKLNDKRRGREKR